MKRIIIPVLFIVIFACASNDSEAQQRPSQQSYESIKAKIEQKRREQQRMNQQIQKPVDNTSTAPATPTTVEKPQVQPAPGNCIPDSIYA